jgi:hypothetical protein
VPQIQEKSPKPRNLAKKHLATNMRRGKNPFKDIIAQILLNPQINTTHLKFTTQNIEIQRKQPCSTLNCTLTNNDEKRRPITTTTKTVNRAQNPK